MRRCGESELVSNDDCALVVREMHSMMLFYYAILSALHIVGEGMDDVMVPVAMPCKARNGSLARKKDLKSTLNENAAGSIVPFVASAISVREFEEESIQ